MLGSAAALEKKGGVNRLEAAIGLVAHLIKRIGNSNMQLADAIMEYDSDVLKSAGFYDGFAGGRAQISKAWQSGIKRLCLDAEAEGLLCGLSVDLGLICREKQLEELGNVCASIADIKKRMEGEYNQKARYYGALGTLFGALAVIVLI